MDDQTYEICGYTHIPYNNIRFYFLIRNNRLYTQYTSSNVIGYEQFKPDIPDVSFKLQRPDTHQGMSDVITQEYDDGSLEENVVECFLSREYKFYPIRIVNRQPDDM